MWKDIAGYYDVYQISSHGKVKRTETGLMLKPNTLKGGYGQVTLSKNKIRRSFLVHRLVGIAFILNPENKPQINHKNAIKNDNMVSNLEWCTSKENNKHRDDNNLLIFACGEQQGNSKLKTKNVLEIRKLAAKGNSHKDIAASFNVDPSTVGDICRRKSWKHI